MKVLFGYQDVLEVIKNGVNPVEGDAGGRSELLRKLARTKTNVRTRRRLNPNAF